MEEKLHYPGFIELDNINKKIITYSSVNEKYKVWDLYNYQFLYQYDSKYIKEIRVANGFLLFILKRNNHDTYQTYKIINVNTGEIYKTEKFLYLKVLILNF